MKTEDIIIFNEVNKHFDYLFKNKPAFRLFFKSLQKYGDILLFGGAVRDIYLANKNPRDYDFVVTFSYDVLKNIVENNFQVNRNSFGGYKIILDGLQIDIWALEHTWAFRNNLMTLSIDNLPETVFFNIDSIVVNLSQGKVVASRFMEALQKQRLDVVLKHNPLPDLCVLKALVLRSEVNFHFSAELNDFIRNWTKNIEDPIAQLYLMQQKHYKKEILSRSKIKEELCAI